MILLLLRNRLIKKWLPKRGAVLACQLASKSSDGTFQCVLKTVDVGVESYEERRRRIFALNKSLFKKSVGGR